MIQEQETTLWGKLVVYFNERTGTFEIIRFGDMQNKIATGFICIAQVGD